MFTAKVAVCSQICTEYINAIWALWRITECWTWWYVKLPLGFKRLMHVLLWTIRKPQLRVSFINNWKERMMQHQSTISKWSQVTWMRKWEKKGNNIGTTGAHSLHMVSNDNGERLIDLATSKNMVISFIDLPHKCIHKRTWSVPDGATFNQINHILIDKHFATSILDVRSFHGANMDTDHYLVRVNTDDNLTIKSQCKEQDTPNFI
jgi:hypothetical protein